MFSNPSSHLAGRVAQHLAVLGGDQSRELGSMAINQISQSEQRVGPGAE